MAKVRSTVEILIKSQVQGENQVQRFAQSLEGVEKQAQGAAQGLNLLQKVSSLLTTALAGYTLREILGFAQGLYDTGIAAHRAETALAAFAGSTWEAEAAIRAVMEATDGAVDRLTAAQMAARLMSMGLARNVEEAGRLARIAVMLGQAMGRDVRQAFEDFTLLLANQSILRLDNFGIASGRVRERMRELAEEMPELDRQTRFVIATLEVAEEKLTALEQAGMKAGTAVDRLRARMRNLYTQAAEGFAAGVEGIVGGIENIVQALEEEHRRILQNSESWEDYHRQVVALRKRLPGIAALIANFVIPALDEQEWRLQKTLATTVELRDGWMVAMEDMARTAQEKTQEMGLSIEELQARMRDLSLFVAGPLREEEERHGERMERLRQKAAELAQKIAELESRSYLTARQKEELENLKKKHDEIQQKIAEEVARHDEATQRIIFNILMRRAALDGLTSAEMDALLRIAEQWGLIDEQTRQAVMGMDQALQELSQTGNIDLFQQRLNEILGKWGELETSAGQSARAQKESLDQVVQDEAWKKYQQSLDHVMEGWDNVEEAQGQARDGVLESLDTLAQDEHWQPVLDQIGRVRQALDEIPREIQVTVRVSQVGGVNLPGGYQGRQHGGPVQAGMPYVVGERGPEIFVPAVSGAIRPGLPGERKVVIHGGVHVHLPRGTADPQRLARALVAELEALGARGTRRRM